MPHNPREALLIARARAVVERRRPDHHRPEQLVVDLVFRATSRRPDLNPFAVTVADIDVALEALL